MAVGISERIRALAKSKYVARALASGRDEFSIRVRDLIGDLKSEGLGSGHTPQICSALKTAKFLRENGLEIIKVDGPQSKMSPTVVFSYRVSKADGQSAAGSDSAARGRHTEEDPAERATRVARKLRGVLKQELSEYGGGEAFLRWIRSEDEDAA
jgi:hypothetical protein